MVTSFSEEKKRSSGETASASEEEIVCSNIRVFSHRNRYHGESLSESTASASNSENNRNTKPNDIGLEFNAPKKIEELEVVKLDRKTLSSKRNWTS